MEAIEAYESYKNGNIADFKKWCKNTSRIQAATLGFLWAQDGRSLIALRAYMGAV